MKKKEIGKLALLGMTAGFLMNSIGLEASELEAQNSINLDCAVSKAVCKAHGGCGGLTADRNIKKTDYQDDADDDDTKNQDESSDNDKDI